MKKETQFVTPVKIYFAYTSLLQQISEMLNNISSQLKKRLRQPKQKYNLNSIKAVVAIFLTDRNLKDPFFNVR